METSERQSEDQKKKEQTKKTYDEKLVDFHSKFLAIIRDVHPLAVLGSLCITIAAFTSQTYPQVSAYAVTAAGLFLIAFTFSFFFRVSPVLSRILLFSYASTLFAIVFLFLVVLEFGKAFPFIGKTMGIVLDAFAVILIGSSIFHSAKTAFSNKKPVWVLFSALFGGSGFMIALSRVAYIVNDVVGVEIIPDPLGDIGGYVYYGGLFVVSLIALIVLTRKNKS